MKWIEVENSWALCFADWLHSSARTNRHSHSIRSHHVLVATILPVDNVERESLHLPGVGWKFKTKISKRKLRWKLQRAAELCRRSSFEFVMKSFSFRKTFVRKLSLRWAPAESFCDCNAINWYLRGIHCRCRNSQAAVVAEKSSSQYVAVLKNHFHAT